MKISKIVTIVAIVFLVNLGLTVGLTWFFLKGKPAPTAQEVAVEILECKLEDGKTISQLIKVASEHPAAPTPKEVAEAIKMPTVQEIATAVLEKLEADGGKVDRILTGTGNIIANTVGTQDSQSKATALEVWKLLASGIDLGDNVLTIVQEGDKAVLVIDPKAAPVASK